MKYRDDEFLFAEKYRPRTIGDCILPKELHKKFHSIIKTGEFQHMIFSGGAGVGKTTVARALCEDLGCDVMVINASLEGNIDTLRTKIHSFASSVSLSETGKPKVVILDEADYLNKESTQPALRNFMETFASNCRFILTCNYPHKILEPIRSRCTEISFDFSLNDRKTMAGEFYVRVRGILTQENIKYDEKVLANLVKLFLPDYRRILNELQALTVTGELPDNALNSLGGDTARVVLDTLKAKKFTAMRKWVSDNINNNIIDTGKKIVVFGESEGYFSNGYIPELILLFNQFDIDSAFATDKEIHLVAFLTQIMMNAEWK